MRKIFWNIILFLGIGLLACSEEQLAPTEEPEFGYKVPQGDHDYDARIVEWNKKCNVFILYDFVPRDIYWSVTGWIEAQEREDPFGGFTWESGLLGVVADQEYVGLQLDLLENEFLNFYPDTLLKRCLPLKILLCSELYSVKTGGKHDFLNAASGYDYLAVNWGSDTICTITEAGKNAFRKDIHCIFLEFLIGKGRIVTDGMFYNGMNYTDAVTNQNMYGRGFIDRGTKKENDWSVYMKAIVSTSYEDLTMETAANDYSYKGILNPKKDINGLIRQKYNIMINHYKTNNALRN